MPPKRRRTLSPLRQMPAIISTGRRRTLTADDASISRASGLFGGMAAAPSARTLTEASAARTPLKRYKASPDLEAKIPPLEPTKRSASHAAASRKENATARRSESSGSSSVDAGGPVVARRERTLTKKAKNRARLFVAAILVGTATTNTFLEMSSVISKARDLYDQELNLFWEYRAKHGPGSKWSELPADVVDLSMVNHCNQLFFFGHDASRGDRLLAAVIDRAPRFGKYGKEGLPRMAQALRGWKKRTPARSRTRLPLFIWCAIASALGTAGHYMAALYIVLGL